MTKGKNTAAIGKREAPRIITVCDQCFRASCWHGVFMCDRARNAGTVDVSASKLDQMALEHPSNYSEEAIARLFGE